ncbi:hypothetical protein DFJ63DRAFT_174642 [Scheffersomyces coipomensis]|uniref:uncharacterized protein n=1 Tax=Scheffersomyces coipomensis TaxID=1788519 RepID=UPI00315D2786
MKFNLHIILSLYLLQVVSGLSYLKSSSLLTCMDNSQFTASFFDVEFYPHNNTVYFDVTALSNINAKVGAYVQLIAYGINAITKNISLCDINYPEVCPMTSGHLDLSSQYTVSDDVTTQIPGVAYGIPNLDATVRVLIYDLDSFEAYACVEASVTNGKTVQTKYAAWPIAAIAGLGVITSGVVSVIGHSNTAAHIASNSMSLFIYFQSLAITAMMAVAKVPPIAAAWAQNFMWSVGIVRVGFVQDIANWYIQATGGTPTDILEANYLSISVQKKVKRSFEYLQELYDSQVFEPVQKLSKRAISLDSEDFGYTDALDPTLYTTDEKGNIGTRILVLRGIQRVAYLAGIEITNLFMTTIIFLLFFAFVMVVCLGLFKAIIEILTRAKIMNEGKFGEYRKQWSLIIKGSLYRLLVLAFPQIVVMCVWQLWERDSAGAVVVAVFLLVFAVILLFQATTRVILFGKRSVKNFHNPAYLLFGDANFLNKFGFLYVQYRADCYYFILVSLIYILLKSIFVALLQRHGTIQSVIVFAIELFYCVAVCVIRPFMDKRTNAFNIAVTVVNTLNALFFMFFSYIFKQPHIVGSVMGVVYFVLNAVFALFLLIFTIVTCVLALVYKNPDTRYKPMKDDRVSFLPRFDNKTGEGNEADEDLELMALGQTAMKGHEHGGIPPVDEDEDDESPSRNIGGKPFEEESTYDDDYDYQRPSSHPLNNSNSNTSNSKSNSNFNFNNGSGNTNNESNSARNSYYFENVEPTQPSSTIHGSGTTGFNTSYNPRSNYQPSTSTPYQANTSYSNTQSYEGNGSRSNFI